MLDERFTQGDGALEVALLLDPQTTPEQRKKAWEALAQEADLFEVGR